MPDFHRTVMPSVFSEADGEWIQNMLSELGPAARGKIATRYAEVYQIAWDSEPVSFKQENKARHEANTRLREFVRKYSAASSGLTAKPKLVGE